MDRPIIVERVLERAGGVNAVARKFQIRPASVSCWRRIPAERVLGLEEMTGISRHEQRPDIFGAEK